MGYYQNNASMLPIFDKWKPNLKKSSNRPLVGWQVHVFYSYSPLHWGYSGVGQAAEQPSPAFTDDNLVLSWY